MFVFDVILSMSLLAKIGATHCTLELHLAVLRLKFLNVTDKHLSGLTCKLINCRYQQQADTHSIQTSNTTYISEMKHNSSFQEMPQFRAKYLRVLPLFPSIDWLKSTMPVSV